MKYKRRKSYRAHLAFFAREFDIRPPYRVLCDGNFLDVAVKRLKLGAEDIARLVATVVEDEVELVTTDAVVRELGEVEGVAPETKALVEMLRLQRVGATAEESRAETPASAIRKLVSRRNKNRFIVATQDEDLKEELRTMPGVPIMTLQRVTVVLEEPSQASVEDWKAGERKKLQADAKALRKRKREFVVGGGDDDDDVSALKEEKEVGLPKPKKKAKAPNPLSVKKKKVKPSTSSSTSPSSTADQQHKRKRRRKSSSASASASVAGGDGSGGES